MKQGADPSRTESVADVLAILELLTEDAPAHTVATIAARLGTTRARALRTLSTLEARDLVEVNEHGAYALGITAAGFARRLLGRVSLIGHARPVLEELARKHGEAVYLSVLRDDEVIFLDVVDYTGDGRPDSLLGKRFPSLTTTAGKAIRALQSRDLLEKIITGRRRRGRVTELKPIFDELDTIKLNGVAVDVREGSSSVATAVRDYAGKVVCALMVIGPSVRMLAERIEEEIVPSLMSGAEALSLKFGYAK